MNNLAQVDIGSSFGGFQGTTSDLITLFVRGSLVIAGVTILFLVLLGGFKIIQGAGSNNPQQAAQGKQALTYAVAGFVVIVLAFLIILILEAITGKTFVTNPFTGGPVV